MKTESIISIRGISKHFRSVIAVDNVDLEIEPGEFFSLLGSSGCGKTTLLRVMAGFETPSAGEVLIDGISMNNVPAHLRPVNMVFQNYAIFPHLDVGANIAFGLRKSGLNKREIETKVDEMLELIKLPGYKHRTSSELSGGERQRVALARALVKQPKVLLLDEPLGALDKKLREQMQLELRALQQSVGVTFVLVTHDQEEALTMSDRIAVMSGGKVHQIASPTELYEQPRSRLVADFIGSINFFRANVVAMNGDIATVRAGPLGTIELEGDCLQKSEQVLLAIRPEKLILHFQRPNAIANLIVGRLGPGSYLGDRSHLNVYVEKHPEPISVAVQNADSSKTQRGKNNQEVWLSFSKSSLILLRS